MVLFIEDDLNQLKIDSEQVIDDPQTNYDNLVKSSRERICKTSWMPYDDVSDERGNVEDRSLLDDKENGVMDLLWFLIDRARSCISSNDCCHSFNELKRFQEDHRNKSLFTCEIERSSYLSKLLG